MEDTVSNDIAIVGMGVVSPLGNSIDVFHRRLLAGDSAARAVPIPADPASRRAIWCTVSGFVPPSWMNARMLEGVDVITQWAASAIDQAIDDAGTELEPVKTAIVHGTSMCGVQSLQQAQHALDKGGPGAVPRKVMLRALSNMAASQIAMHRGLHGPCLTLSTACASTLDALGQAAALIRAGRADVALAAGTEAGHSLESAGAHGDFVPALFHAPVLMGMSSNADLAAACRPFDIRRAGILTSEGSAAFVLERGSLARARGARIHGYLRGYGSLADAHHPSAPEPSGRWEALAMTEALRDARMESTGVGALYAHATGTPKGDTAEIRAINAVHDRRDAPLPVTSVKGQLGHAAAASGGMSLIAALLGMRDGEIVPTAGAVELDPEIAFEVVTGSVRELRVDAVQVNAFGFGGQNASIVVSREPGH